MKLIATSDFPVTGSEAVAARIRAAVHTPRIAWIPERTDASGAAFAHAREQFGALGFEQLELVDIEDDRDDVQIAYLHEFDVIYLTADDALRLRYNALRTGLAGRLRQCAAHGRLIVTSGAASMLLTPNVSLSKLQQEPLESVLATRPRFDALGAVSFEIMPHAQRLAPAVLEAVCEYSRKVDNDVVCLADGGAIFPTSPDAFEAVGTVTRYRKGNIIEP